MEYTHGYDSPLGRILLSGKDGKLTGLWFEGQKHFAATLEEEHEEKELPVFQETARWLDLYFQGKEPSFLPDLSVRTTPFRKKVCEALLKIPYGKTMTYRQVGELVRKEGENISFRAIGSAIAHNPISIIIPCHRVLGSDGSLTGYAGGVERKRRLLEMEGNKDRFR